MDHGLGFYFSCAEGMGKWFRVRMRGLCRDKG